MSSDPQQALEVIHTQHWAILPIALNAIITAATHLQETSASALAIGGSAQSDDLQLVQIRGNVAVVRVIGPLVHHANPLTRIVGGTSIDKLMEVFGSALRNSAVESIVLEIDSPGGMLGGISEFAEFVRDGSRKKRVTSYVSNMAASGAYWIAAAAGDVIIRDTACVGGIGIVSRAYRDDATNVVKFVSSQSPRKHADPTSKTGQLAYQATIDDLAQVFIEKVAAYRAVSTEVVLQQFGQGFLVMGDGAVAVGMADRLGSLQSAISGETAPPQASRNRQMATAAAETTQAFSEERAREIFRRSPALQAEFSSEDHYLAFAYLEATGGCRFPEPAPSAVPVDAFELRARAAWAKTPSLQAKFGTADRFVEHLRYRADKPRIYSRRSVTR